MSLRASSLLLLGSSVLMSCAQPDLRRAAQGSQRTVAHARYEQRLQLPAGSLTEKASLDAIEADRPLCFSVLLRSFSDVDLRNAEVSLRADDRAVAASGRVTAGEPITTTYSGIVFRKHQVGTKTQCIGGHRDDGSCPEYGSVPTYAKRRERGDVTIHESHGQVCFPDEQAKSAQALALEVRIRLAEDGTFRTQRFRFELSADDAS